MSILRVMGDLVIEDEYVRSACQRLMVENARLMPKRPLPKNQKMRGLRIGTRFLKRRCIKKTVAAEVFIVVTD